MSETAPPPQERIRIIADMMRSLEWERGKSGPKLAELWGLSLKSIENNAAEASRIVRAEVSDPDEVGRTVAVALQRVLKTSLDGGVTADGTVLEPDHKTAVKAAEVWAKIAGAMAPTKTENVNVDVTSEASPAKARDLIREVFGSAGAKDDGEPADEAGVPDAGEVPSAE